MKVINNNLIRQIFVLLLILIIGGLIASKMIPYLSGILGAIIIYVLLKNMMHYLVRKGWNPSLSAGILMFFSFVIILLPVAGILLMLGGKVSDAVNQSNRLVKVIESKLNGLEDQLGYDITSNFDASSFSGWLSENLQGLAGNTFTTVISISIMYFLLYYMLTNPKKIRESLLEYLPFNGSSLSIIVDETRQMVRANALGIPLVAIAQGVVSIIGFFIFGVENPFFWAVIVTFGSMIPFVGSMLGTIPVFILMLSEGSNFQAWGILLYGLVVISSTDNIIRLFVLQKLDNVHPLITLIGVIIGIPLFGFVGIIFGPLLVSIFLIVIKIYKKQYT